MALSAATLAKITEAIAQLTEFREKRLAEIDDQVAALRSFDVTVGSVAEKTSDKAVGNTAALVNSILG